MPKDRKRLAKSIYSAGGIGLVLLIILLMNLIASQADVRWDATQDNLYSLSKGTRTILDGLPGEVTIKVFYSSRVVNMPSHIKTFASRTLDFLSEYEYYSAGKVKIEQYDPVEDSEEEDWAQKYGLQGISLPSGERVYFGIVAVHADQKEAIAFIDPGREEHLEYDITRIISRVSHPKKEKIAILSNLPIFGTAPMGMMMPGMPQQGSDPWLFVQELKKSYTVEPLDPSADTVDADTDLLILFNPKNLSNKLLYAIDQHVLSGRNLMVFADPVSVMDDPRSAQMPSNLQALFKAWGVTMDTGKVVADFSLATRLRNQNNQPELNPLWLSTRPQAFNTQDIITAKLESTLLPVAGALDKEKDSTYEFAPLIQSSPNSQLVEALKAQMDVESLKQDFKPSNQKFNLAVKIGGAFKSAFPDGPAKDAPKPGEEPPKDSPEDKSASPGGLKQAEKKATIVIVADSDLLYDGYFVSKQNFLGYTISNVFNDNLNLLLNSAEILTGSDALIEIRSRGSFDRPFTRVAALEEKAQARWRDREQELVKKVEQTNDTLRQLEQQKDASQRAIISPEQQAEIEKFQEEKRQINDELKIVRRNLRADIESLGRVVKFINIFLMPLLVSLAGILYAVYLSRKRSAA